MTQSMMPTIDQELITGSFKLTVSADLMENYATGGLLAATTRSGVSAVQDHQGDPSMFTIGERGGLFLLRRHGGKESTGWRQTEITPQDATGVEAFGVSQSGDGNVVIYAAVATGAAREIRYRTLSPSAFAAEEIGGDWAVHQFRPTAPVISVVLGEQAASEPQPHVIVTMQAAGAKAVRRVLNWGEEEVANFPRDVDELYDTALGRLRVRPGAPVLRGIYALYRSGSETKLDFTSEPVGGVPIYVPLPAPSTARSIATVLRNGMTDLYAGGAGLWLFLAETQGAKKPVAEEIATAADVPSARRLIARADPGGATSLWALGDDGNLLHSSRRAEPAPGERVWSFPAIVKSKVAAVTAIRNGDKLADELLFVTSDERLFHRRRDPYTTLWHQTDVPLPDDEKLQTYPSYTTHVSVEDPAGQPLTGDAGTFLLTCSEWMEVTINGVPHVLAPQSADKSKRAVRVQTDAAGAITLIHKAPTLASPVFTLMTLDRKHRQSFDPATKVRGRLENIKTPAALTETLGVAPDPKSAAAAVESLKNLTVLREKLPADGTKKPAAETRLLYGDDAPAWGIRFSGGGMELIDPAEAAATFLAAQESANSFWSWLGDALETIRNAANKVIEFVVKAAEAVITIGTKTIRCVIESVGQVLSAMHAIVEKLGADMATLVLKLGPQIGWDDVKVTHGVLINLFDQTCQYGKDRIRSMKNDVEQALTDLEKKIRELTLPDDLGKKNLFAEQKKVIEQTRSQGGGEGLDFMTKSPMANFASYHLAHSGAGRIPATFELAQASDLDMVLRGLFTEEEIERLQSLSTGFWEKVGKSFQTGKIEFGTALGALIGEGTAKAINFFKRLLIAILEFLEAMLDGLVKMITAEIPVPFLSAFYRSVTGRTFNLRDGILLLVSMPVTMGYKLFSGGVAPFPKGNTFGLDKIGWRELFGVGAAESAGCLATPPPQYSLTGGLCAPVIGRLLRIIAIINATAPGTISFLVPGVLLIGVSAITVPVGTETKPSRCRVLWIRWGIQAFSIFPVVTGPVLGAIHKAIPPGVRILLSMIRTGVAGHLAADDVMFGHPDVVASTLTALNLTIGTVADGGIFVYAVVDEPTAKAVAALVAEIAGTIAMFFGLAVAADRIIAHHKKKP